MKPNSISWLALPLGLIQAFIGVGALVGGFLLVSDPTGNALGMPLSLLSGSMFPNFLVPGVFLLVVNGIGSLAGAWLSFVHHRYAAGAALVLGAMLLAWMTIQVVIIGLLSWWQPVVFLLGITEFVAGGLLWSAVQPNAVTAQAR